MKYDIAIIGSGPAGSSAALTLRNSNYKVALFDKETFPRQKICGDGICDRSVNTLKKISEDYYKEFLSLQPKLPIKKTALTYKNKKYLLNFKSFGYVFQRINFDNFLFNLIQRDCKNIDIHLNTTISDIQKSDHGYLIYTKNGSSFFSSIIIIANGAKSSLESKLTGSSFSKDDNEFAIRSYYKGVKGLEPDTIELHYKKEYFPGYLWVFPVAEDLANVGFGCHFKDKNNKQIKFAECFHKWIQSDKSLRERFSEAHPTERLKGGLIPYYNKGIHCAGEHYMICGDAAALIDPISAGGIGNAMLSGYYAALQAEKCCYEKDFSAATTKIYENNLKNHIYKEIRTRLFIQKTISNHLWLLDILAFIGKSSTILSRIQNWYMK